MNDVLAPGIQLTKMVSQTPLGKVGGSKNSFLFVFGLDDGRLKLWLDSSAMT